MQRESASLPEAVLGLLLTPVLTRRGAETFLGGEAFFPTAVAFLDFTVGAFLVFSVGDFVVLRVGDFSTFRLETFEALTSLLTRREAETERGLLLAERGLLLALVGRV